MTDWVPLPPCANIARHVLRAFLVTLEWQEGFREKFEMLGHFLRACDEIVVKYNHAFIVTVRVPN